MTGRENGQHDGPRDVGFERAFTATAAGQVGHNPTSITRLAEQRAPLEPVGFHEHHLARELLAQPIRGAA
jgi:hypothetical protein